MHRRFITIAALALMLGADGDAVPAQDTTTATARPVLLELFTSEGCSSCPPADALLRQMEGRRTSTGQRIIALSEHVTYWNRLGWADPFSSDAMTQRQQDYADRFQLGEVYTPQMVVNGDREMVGNDEKAVDQAVRVQDKVSPVKVEILSMDIPARQPDAKASQSLRVTCSLRGQVPAHGVDIYAALADDQDTTHVGRGENAGRTLTHVSVVRSLVRAERAKMPKELVVILPLPETTGSPYSGGRHVVVFAQTPGLGKVLDVALRPVPGFPTNPPAVATVH